MNVNILAVGDVTGPEALDFFCKRLNSLKKLYGIGFTVVNGENASGIGITPSQADMLLDAGTDVITLGNHTWGKNGIEDYLDDCRYIVRPANFAPQVPGRGYVQVETSFGRVCVINLIGRCSMNFGPDNPFFTADRILKDNDCAITLVDFHAEATSEKLAMANYLDGRVSALWGTHTHVQTSDAAVFPKGMGYITDLGMTGPVNSVIGIAPELSVSMFLGNPPKRYRPAHGPSKIEGAVFTIDTKSGLCTQAEAIRIM